MDLTMEYLLSQAKKMGASDLHITVGVTPKCRVNGILVNMNDEKLSPENTEQLIFSMMEHKFKTVLAKKGEVDFAYSIPESGRYRVNVFKQKGTYSSVIRLVDMAMPSLEQIGLPESVIELTKKKRGLILVTGPTGSGKSTTLAAFIDLINRNYNYNIITIEDPIEYFHTHNQSIINQREIGLDTISYSNALRAALREDPDVILVGELKDLDTISTAIMAAETGHLVFSTVHTIGAAETIDRLIDVFPVQQQQYIRVQLASVLEAIISQQLIPMDTENGMVAAYEIMHTTSAIKNLIRESKSHQITSIIQTSKKLGMQTMDDAIYDLYLKRKINVDQMLEYAQDAIALERKL